MMRLLFVALALGAAPVLAQDKIGKPVRLVVGFAAGGSVDLVARLMAERLSPRLGQPVLVENKPGGFVRVAIEAVRAAPADGTTLLLTSSTPLVVTPHATPRSLTTRSATVSVARLVYGQQGFALGPMSGARTWTEYVSWLKANPDKAFFASSGVGSMGHLVGVVLANTSGLRLEHVAYKGSGHYNAELMGGQVSAGISGIADAADFHRSGKLRIVATRARSARARFGCADIPGARRADGPVALVRRVRAGRHAAADRRAPRPRARRDRRRAGARAALRKPGTGTGAGRSERCGRRASADFARWRPIVQQAGFKLD